MTRFIPPAVATLRQPNRGAISRELLALLGYDGDVDPDLLFFLKDATRDDWTTENGADTTIAATDRGVVEASAFMLRLDAQTERAYARVNPAGGNLPLPVGTYVGRVRVRCLASVAGDLGIKVRNQTDATDILAEVTFDPRVTANASTFGVIEFTFSVRAADAGDEIRFYVEKKTATANDIRIDYLSLQPAAARRVAWGEVPPGGRIVFARAGGAGTKVTSHTVYDAGTGGNVVETGAYTYDAPTNPDRLLSIAYTRDGRTATKTFVYDGSGDVTDIKWS